MSTTEQPQAQAPMVVGPGGNRNAKNIPVDANGQRAWSNDLFDCLGDPATCLFAWFLPCVIYGKNKTRLQSLSEKGVPHPGGGEVLGEDTLIFCALTACCHVGWIVGMAERGAIRARYKIEGSVATDCATSWCCVPCALTQQSREIELEEQSLGHPGGGMSQKLVAAGATAVVPPSSAAPQAIVQEQPKV